MIPRNTTSVDLVSSQVTLISDVSFQGALFSCHLTSSAFPNRQRSCYIGPINIHDMATNNVETVPRSLPIGGGDLIINQDTQRSGECNY